MSTPLRVASPRAQMWAGNPPRQVNAVLRGPDPGNDGPPPGPSQFPVPTASLTGWKFIASDDFIVPVPDGTWINNSAYRARWRTYNPGTRDTNPGKGLYDLNRTSSIANSCLKANLHYDATIGEFVVFNATFSTVADAASNILSGQTYGRYEICLRANVLAGAGGGYKIVPLLWPRLVPWPTGGEIDQPEGDVTDGGTTAAFHHWATAGGGQNKFLNGVNMNEFHKYATEWSPGLVKFLVDDVVVGQSSTLVPDSEMRWTLQFETRIGAVPPPTDEIALVEVDWVAMWSYIAPPPPPPPTGFTHPGVLLTTDMINYTKAKLTANLAPWTTEYTKLVNAKADVLNATNNGLFYSSLTWPEHPWIAVGRGSSGTPSEGDGDLISDAQAAYTHALIWAYKGTRANALKAIRILNAWAADAPWGDGVHGAITQVKFDTSTYTDGLLLSGWAGSILPRAAEIIRYTFTSTGSEEVLNVAKIKAMFTNVFIPRVRNGWTGGGANWLTSMAEGLMNMAVFNDDQTLFDLGCSNWRKWVPSTIYMIGDVNRWPQLAGLPITPPGTIYDTATTTATQVRVTYWYSPTAFTNGLGNEEGRKTAGNTKTDVWHIAMGLGGTANGAETAYHQGVDLYGEEQNRLMAGWEKHYGRMYQIFVAGINPPNDGWEFGTIPMDNTSPSNSQCTTSWMAYNHYVHRKGLAMPKTLSAQESYANARTYRTSSHMLHERLTHWQPGFVPTTPPVDPPPTPTPGRTPISTAPSVYATGASVFTPPPNKTTLAVPLPTNSWFENFMVGTGNQPVNMFPYDIKVTAQGLDICFPVLNTSNANSVLATMLQNISLRATATSNTQKVTGFTDLGCSLAWVASTGSMTSDVVRGMAYVTMKYTTLVPVITTQNAITAINGTAVGATGTFTGTKFKLTMNNGQTWLVYAATSITLTLSTANTLTASAAYSGTIRVALMPAQTGSEAALDASAPVIPTGGSVEFSVAPTSSDETYNFASTGTGNLLMYALPHHQDWLDTPAYAAPQLTTLRGVMRSVTGNTWNLVIPMPTIGWNNAGAINATWLPAVQGALTVDKTFVPQVADPYFGGKQLAKAARLILIADQVGDTTSRTTLLNSLRTAMNNYLGGALATQLRYDTVWGGIVSVAGLTNQDADFGNGRYNDHHFHYGYVIYSAAVLTKFDATWGSTNLAKVNDLVRDIANPSTADPYFTPMRHFDWYESHSWAAGNFEFGDNRNQESTSEAVNAWYGVYLWGLISNQTMIADIGRFLFAQEVKAAQRYWQIKSTDTIYPSPFKNHASVGILWSNKVDYATFFGAQDEYIIGIQILPVTPATEVLIPDAWVNDRWTSSILPLWTRTSVWRAELIAGGSGYAPANISPSGQGYTDGLSASGGTGTGLVFNVNITAGSIVGVFIVFNQHGSGYTDGDIITLNGSGGTGARVKVYTTPEDGWKAVLLGALAQVDPNTAWTMTNQLTGFDDGSSKTQALYHIATQAGAAPGSTTWDPLSGIKPSATNTGLLPGWSESMLTVVTGDQTITTANTIIENKYIKGRIIVATTGVTIRNCVVETQVHYSNSSACVDCSNAAVRTCTITNCVLRQSAAGAWFWIDGIMGHDYTARYNNIYQTVDGFRIFNSKGTLAEQQGPVRVTIENNYVHDHHYHHRSQAEADADPANGPKEPHSNDQTHNDGVQIEGGTGYIIRGNYLDTRRGPTSIGPAPQAGGLGCTGQTIGITPNVSAVTGGMVDSNYLNGGFNANFIAVPNSFPTTDAGTVRNNKSGPDRGYPGSTAVRIRIDPPVTYTSITNNTWESDGTPVPTQGL